MELETFTLRCDCGTIRKVSVTCEQIVFCNKCNTRLTGKHYVHDTLVTD